MEKLIRVKAMKNCYVEMDPENRPGLGKLYLKGQEFKCPENQFSDYDKVVESKRGATRGAMRRLDKPEAVTGGPKSK